MSKTRKAKIGITLAVLLLVGGGAIGWRIWRSGGFDAWLEMQRFNRKMTRLAKECAESGRPLGFMSTDRGELRFSHPVLEEEGRFILPAMIEMDGSPNAVLTRYDLVVFDDWNENDTQDHEEPGWTWLEEREEGIAFEEVYSPARKRVSEHAGTLRRPRYVLEIANSITGTAHWSGEVLPLAKTR